MNAPGAGPDESAFVRWPRPRSDGERSVMTPVPPARGRPAGVEQAWDALEQFGATYGRPALELALHAAVAERLRPDLLALMRLNFLPDEHRHARELDAYVLFGPVCRELGGDYFRMDNELRRHCILTLDAWSARLGEPMRRSAMVGRLIFRHVRNRRETGSSGRDPAFDEYLDLQLWGALAFIDPRLAAHRLAREVRRSLPDPSGIVANLRLGSIGATVELPLAGFPALLSLARGLDAVARGDPRGPKILEALHDHDVRIGNVYLPSGGHILARLKSAEVRPESTAPAPVNEREPEEVDDVSDESAVPGEGRLATPPVIQAAARGDVEALEKILTDRPQAVGEADASELTALHVAARRGHLKVARTLLDHGAAVDAHDHRDRTALSLAAAYGHDQLVDLLLDAGAAIDNRRKLGLTPYLDAILFGHAYVALQLARRGADIRAATPNGSDATHMAAWSGRVSFADGLVDRGFAVDAPRNDGYSPLLIAAYFGHTAFVDWAIDLGASPDRALPAGWTALHQAAQEGHLGVVEALLAHGADANRLTVSGWAALHAACSGDRADVVSRLLEDSAAAPQRLTQEGWSPFHLACRNAAGRTITALLADPRTDPVPPVKAGFSPLHLALYNSEPSALDVLLADARVVRDARDSEGRTPLEQALRDDNAERTEQLLATPGIDLNQTDKNGLPLLHRVISGDRLLKGDQEALYDRLLELGADPNATDSAGMTPLNYAALHGKTLRWIQSLLVAGADHQRAASDGSTALHLIKGDQASAVVETLLAHGADPRHPDAVLQTPLHRAAGRGDTESMKLLIEAGATVNARAATGETPLFAALASFNEEAVAMLIRHGADVHAIAGRGWAPLLRAVAVRPGKPRKVESSQAASNPGPMVAQLLAAGADPNVAAPEGLLTPGRSALEIAVAIGTVESVAALTTHGMWPPEDPNDARPLIECAITYRRFRIALKLLEIGGEALGMTHHRAETLLRRLASRWPDEGVSRQEHDVQAAAKLVLVLGALLGAADSGRIKAAHSMSRVRQTFSLVLAEERKALRRRLEIGVQRPWTIWPVIPGDWRDLPIEEAEALLAGLWPMLSTPLAQMLGEEPKIDRFDAIRQLTGSALPDLSLYEARTELDDGREAALVFAVDEGRVVCLTGDVRRAEFGIVSRLSRVTSEEQALELVRLAAATTFRTAGVIELFDEVSIRRLGGAEIPVEVAQFAEGAHLEKARTKATAPWSGRARIRYSGTVAEARILVHSAAARSLSIDPVRVYAERLAWAAPTFVGGLRTTRSPWRGAEALIYRPHKAVDLPPATTQGSKPRGPFVRRSSSQPGGRRK